MRKILEETPEQIVKVKDLGNDVTLKRPTLLVMVGMGGSSIPGRVIRNVVDIPVIVVSDATVPFYKDATYCVASYSGNAQETIAAFKQLAPQCKKGSIITISSGGDLQKEAQRFKIPHISVPSGVPPRFGVLYQTIPLLNVLAVSGCCNPVDCNKLSHFLNSQQQTIRSKAKSIARDIGRKIPLIYTSLQFSSVGYKWKINFNENTKRHAFVNTYPEWQHNEINAVDREDLCVVVLHNHDDSTFVKRRMEITHSFVNSKIIHVSSAGYDKLSRLCYTMLIGDWVSYELAKKDGINPLPIPKTEQLKQMLK